MPWSEAERNDYKDEYIEQLMIEIRSEHPHADYRTMVELLKQRDFHVNHKKVQRIMEKLGLQVTTYWRKLRKYNSYKGEIGKIAQNKLKRRFNTSVPHQKITTDTTEFKYYGKGVIKNT